MRIDFISRELKLLFTKCIIANELGGDLSLVYIFSDPDGVRTGKSGWSFGVVQYDINNNASALLALRDMDFTTEEILGLKAQTIDIKAMNQKLVDHKDIVDSWDMKQLLECLTWSLKLCNEVKTDFTDEAAFLSTADYHNQFGFSRGGRLYTFLKGHTQPVSSEMIRDFKYTLPWGIKQLAKNDPSKDDVFRRYSNIIKICHTR